MEYSNYLIDKTLKLSLIISTIIMVISLIISKKLIYSGIILFATLIAISGFLFTIKALDKFLNKKKGKWFVLFVFFLKLIVIAIGFYPVSRISEIAVLFYIAGISVVTISLMLGGISHIFEYKKDKLSLSSELSTKGS